LKKLTRGGRKGGKGGKNESHSEWGVAVRVEKKKKMLESTKLRQPRRLPGMVRRQKEGRLRSLGEGKRCSAEMKRPVMQIRLQLNQYEGKKGQCPNLLSEKKKGNIL